MVTLFLHLMVVLVRLARPGGFRSVVAESVLMRHQLRILNRGRKRASNLRAANRECSMEPVFDGLVLLRRQTPLTPRLLVYFASGACGKSRGTGARRPDGARTARSCSS